MLPWYAETTTGGAVRMPPTVAVVDTSEEVADLLCQVVEEEGWRAVHAYTTDLKRGREDLAAFLAEHRPAAVIWDIALPYDENWAFFQSVRDADAGRGCRFVLTTTNKRALEALVGPTPAHELIGKPYDLDVLVAALRRALGEPPA